MSNYLRLRWQTTTKNEWGHATQWEAHFGRHHLSVRRLDADAYQWRHYVNNIRDEASQGGAYSLPSAQQAAEAHLLEALETIQANWRVLLDMTRPHITKETP